MYQLDLATEWRSRRWRRLLNLIDGLPANTHFRDAQARDEDLAEAWLEYGADQGEREERFSDWSPEMWALADIKDLLQDIARVIIAVNSGNPPTFKPARRPESALSRAEERRRIAAHRRLTAILLPSTAVDEQAEQPGDFP